MTLNRTPIHVNDAVKRVADKVQLLGTEVVGYNQSYGKVLAKDLTATSDVPLFSKSAMDGFAFNSKYSAGASGDKRIAFKVVEEIPAGSTSDYELQENEAFRIMTGAEIPQSANAVVMFEQTKETEDGFTIRREFKAGENIAHKGEECRTGDIIVEKGTTINPGTIATLATFGYSEVEVYRQPVVGVLSTGTELLDVTDELERGKIRNSNTPMILGQLARMGIEGKHYKLQTDDFDTLYTRIEAMLKEVDVIITTGGVSVGDYDLLPKIYEKLGAEVLFNKVAMRPGSVTTVSILNDKLLFGLSGNPSACYSGFELFARPALNLMQNAVRPFAPVVDAILDEDFTKANPFSRFIRAELFFAEGKIYARPSGFNKSNAVTSIARSNGVIVLPGGSRGFEKGDAVKVMLTDVTTGSDSFVVD